MGRPLITKLPGTHEYTVKNIKRMEEGEELDLIIACAFDHVLENPDPEESHYLFTFDNTDQKFKRPVRYSRDPRFLQFMLEKTASIGKVKNKEHNRSHPYDGSGVYDTGLELGWGVGPVGHEGVSSFVYGPTPLLACSRYVALLWKWKYL